MDAILKDDDIVDLIFITPHNFLYVLGITRKKASDEIRCWYKMRNAVMNGATSKEESLKWLTKGTFATNYIGEGETSYANWAIGMEHVLGMYVRERDTVQQQELEARTMVAKAMEKMSKDLGQGEQWKGDDE